MFTTSGTFMHQSRTTRNRSSSQSGSAMILIDTSTPNERANSNASKLRPSGMRLRNLRILVERLDTDEDVSEAELLPELEYLLVSQQHVAAGLQPEVLANSLAGDRFPDGKAVPLMNERDVVNNENTRLADGGEILDHAFRAAQPIAAAIESPGAAERAIPWGSHAKI